MLRFLTVAPTVILILLFGILPLHAQDNETAEKNTYLFARGSYQYGYVLKTNSFVDGSKNQTGKPIDWYQAGRAELGWQTTGSQPWHQIWGYPAFGVGFYAGDYFEKGAQLGNPLAVYGFAIWPLQRKKAFTLTLQMGFGLSWNWQPFDPVTNPDNVAIGAFRAAYTDRSARRLMWQTRLLMI